MVYIIAEAGVNHNGWFPTAIRLIDTAKYVGADCVKFQLFSAERLGQPELQHLELSADEMGKLKQHAEGIGIDFLCTAFSIEDAQALLGIGCSEVKLSSRSVADFDLIDFCCANFETVYLSTGNPGQDEPRGWNEIDYAGRRGSNLRLLHCVSKYPTPDDEAHLSRVKSLDGYSDHTIGVIAPIIAVAFGAKIIEKHLTLDNNRIGPDHATSAEPGVFRKMVEGVRKAEAML